MLELQHQLYPTPVARITSRVSNDFGNVAFELRVFRTEPLLERIRLCLASIAARLSTLGESPQALLSKLFPLRASDLSHAVPFPVHVPRALHACGRRCVLKP